MNQNFIKMLTSLNTPNKIKATKTILHRYEEGVANDSKLYSNPAKLKGISNSLFDSLSTTNVVLESLIKICKQSPYNIFNFIFKENFSDIMIHSYGIRQMDNNITEKWRVPDELKEIYNVFVGSLINNVTYMANSKFDTGNSVLDMEIDKFRFNMIHGSLTTSSLPVLVIRKQTIKKSFHLSEEYVKSLGCSERQLEIIHKFAKHGNFIIFGETGSGKTTLLKYMASYKLEEKPNLCIIEDTSELNIETPISLLTNTHKKIKDLFTAALRQNPSHIIIGETRTDEIIDILESALTISVGTTIHANSFLRAIQRIVFMSISRHIDIEEVLNLINATVDCFIFMENRKIKGIWSHKDEMINDVYKAYEEIV